MEPEEKPDRSAPALSWSSGITRKQEAIHARGALRLIRSRRPRVEPIADFVPLPRFLVRSGIFRRADRPEPIGREEIEVPNGQTLIQGTFLSWQDLRTVAVIGGLAELMPRQLEEVYLPPDRLVRYLGKSGGGVSSELASESLARLSTVRMALLQSTNPGVGSETELEPFLTPDPRQEHTYLLASWLRGHLYTGLKLRQGAHLQFGVSRAMLVKLQKLHLLIYAYLECERWDKHGLTIAPADREAGVPAQSGYCELTFSDPMLRLFELDRVSRGQQRRLVVDAIRMIMRRDWRYRDWEVKNSRHLGVRDVAVGVYRLPRAADPDLLYMGAYCPGCGLPDPHRVCCCPKTDADRETNLPLCQKEDCPRCQRANR